MARTIKPVQPLTYEEFFSNYAGSKRRAYESARDSLNIYPIAKKDAQINMFVKSERINPIVKCNPDPRPISARNKRYVLEIGRWLKPLEHAVYKNKFGFPSRVIVKGMNQVQRANLLIRKTERFDEYVVFSLDCSRWDKHVSYELLQLEHSFYNSKCRDPLLARLLSWQLINRCKTRNGIRYTTRGKRMSGDYNTALGNCLLMTAMAINVFDAIGIKYDIMDDGDDCLIIIERRDMHRVVGLPSVFLDFGQELKVENKAYNLESVVFCQSSPVNVQGTWKFVRNPYKVLSNSTTGFIKLRDQRMRRKMFYAIGSCELALNVGVPILQALALKLISLGVVCDVRKMLDGNPDFQDMAYRVKGYALNVRPNIIDTTTRLSFMNAFGITITEQLDIETVIELWNPDIFDEYEVPVDYCHILRCAMDCSSTGH